MCNSVKRDSYWNCNRSPTLEENLVEEWLDTTGEEWDLIEEYNKRLLGTKNCESRGKCGAQEKKQGENQSSTGKISHKKGILNCSRH